jgi:hypothetical protein
MSVDITDNRDIWSNCDTADWDIGEAETLYTTSPDPKELTGCLGFVISEENSYMAHSGTAADLSAGVLCYVWMLFQGSNDDIITGGAQVLLYDGTNAIGYHLGGSDVAGFRHDEGTVNWQCFLLDTVNLPANYTIHTGTTVGFALGTTTGIGAGASVASKALGNTENVFVDRIAYGNDGLAITGGLPGGTEGNFDEIATADADDTSNASSYEACRKLGAGNYGLQAPLNFGLATGTSFTHFKSTNETATFEDRSIGTDYYYIKVTGNSTGTTLFQLGEQIGATTEGSDGTTLSCPAGVGAYFNATGTDVDFVLLYGGSFVNFDKGMDFSTNTTHAPNHEIYGYSFRGCAQIDPGLTLFKNNSISDTADSTTGALLLDDDGTTNIQDLFFTSGGLGHAVYIASTTTDSYTLTNWNYSGYSEVGPGSNLVPSTGSTNDMIYNNSGKEITLTVSGGTVPTVRNGAGATTIVVTSVPISVTAKNKNTLLPIEDASLSIYVLSTREELMNKLSNASGVSSTDYTGGTPITVEWRARKSDDLDDPRYFGDSGITTIQSTVGMSVEVLLEPNDFLNP